MEFEGTGKLKTNDTCKFSDNLEKSTLHHNNASLPIFTAIDPTKSVKAIKWMNNPSNVLITWSIIVKISCRRLQWF